MSALLEDPVDVRIERWRKNLVDTSLRNRLLDVKESRLGCLRLMEPPSQTIFRTLVEAKGSFEVEVGPNGSASCATRAGPGAPAPAGKGRGDRSLMLIRTKAREAKREQGINVLFLTLGVLEWSSEGTQGQKVRSPLLLIPVDLARAGPLDPYVLRASGEVTVNPTLAHKLRSELSLSLPPMPEGPLDVAAYLEQVRRSFLRLGWEAADASYLGLFKFPKMCMYDELGQHREVAAGHPVIRALSGEAVEHDVIAPLLPGAGVDYQVLDADSSQQEAISMAVSGSSFVLQGPPGTGKSQTIANIIAEVVSRGRTVLFVSEKMAALEVVKKRLDARGLGDYCLEIHDHDARRQDVVDELSRCLSATAGSEPLASEQEELDRARSHLDEYMGALHQVRDGLGISYRELLSELTALRAAPELPMGFPNLERLGWKDLAPLHPLVRDVERYAPLLASDAVHPWSDCLEDSWKLSAQTEIAHQLSGLKMNAGRLRETLEGFCKDLDVEMPPHLKGVNDLIEHIRAVNLTAYPEEKWLASDPTPLLTLLDDTKAAYLGLGDRIAWLRQGYREDVLALDLHAMHGRFQNDYKGKLKRLFSINYRRDMGALRSLYRGQRKLKFEPAREDLEEIIQISDQVTELHALEGECGERLGKHFQGENTDWEKVRAAINWTKAYFDHYGTPRSPGIVRLLCSGPDELVGLKTKVDGLQDAAMRMEGSLSPLSARFDMGRLTAGRTVHEVPFEDIANWAQEHMDTMPRFQEWTEVQRVRKEARERGLGDLLVLSSQGTLPASGLWDGVRKRYLALWHDLILSRDRRLRDFDREAHERTIERFAELDRCHIDRAGARAKVVLDARRRELCDLASPELGSGLWVLKHEVSRKRNLRPVRELFSQAIEPIQALKPCLLMSPLSVSTFLDPSRVRFDLTIFDEASQVRPEDAIGSIMRAKQVIVVGDGKQLPPTDFFREVNDEDESVPDLESILDESSSALPQRMLRWHYRSRQESLIAFSNRRFYGGRLVTFPSATTDHDGLGVAFVHVPDGVYDRSRTRKNVREAEVVAEMVVEHLTGSTGGSLGVVAFSEPQQMAIIEELEKHVARRPSLGRLLSDEGEEGFFVKNLENVQGDERDVMIFSVGYGRDAQGKMYQNFGPLNKAGGERRLNVAITRARMHIKLVSSMLPEDVEATTAGTAALREYMAYARSADHEDAGAAKGGRTDGLQSDVRAWLESRGLVVEEQVGRSEARVDLAVADRNRPGNHVLGILLDGPSYLRAGAARDRERLRVDVLTGLGWSIHRLWSQEWIRDRDREGERALAALDRARALAAERSAEEERQRAAVLVVSPAMDDTYVEEMPAEAEGPVEMIVQDAPLPNAPVAEPVSPAQGSPALDAVDPAPLTAEPFVAEAGAPVTAIEAKMPTNIEVPVAEAVEALPSAEENIVPAEVAVTALPEPAEAVPAEMVGHVQPMLSAVEEAVNGEIERSLDSSGTAAPSDGVAEGMCPLYRRVDLREVPSLVRTYGEDQPTAMLEAVEIIVGQEGPVHLGVVRERVRELVSASTGKRAGNVDRATKQAVDALVEQGKVRAEGEFLWPAGLSEAPTRRCDGFRRDVDQVCDAEIEAMVYSLLPTDRPANMKEVIDGVSSLLGYKRSTPSIKKRVEHAVDDLDSKGAVASEEPDGKCAPPKAGAEGMDEEACP
ncbi:MAG: DUF4011 domain-containing protein [Methanomassiliicoccus sp.]|nr:DUF4011 domain-containing protein [Methanomassiliicoccus sp.]